MSGRGAGECVNVTGCRLVSGEIDASKATRSVPLLSCSGLSFLVRFRVVIVLWLLLIVLVHPFVVRVSSCHSLGEESGKRVRAERDALWLAIESK